MAPETALVSLLVPHIRLGRRHDGEVLRVRDTRDARRSLSLTAMDGGFVVSANRTTYRATGATLIPEDADDQAELGLLAPIEQSLLLRPGDVLELNRDCSPNDGAPLQEDRAAAIPAVAAAIPTTNRRLCHEDNTFATGNEDASMELVDERLTGTFAGQFGADSVRAAIDEVYQQFRDVSVRDFVPLLTERRCASSSTPPPRVWRMD